MENLVCVYLDEVQMLLSELSHRSIDYQELPKVGDLLGLGLDNLMLTLIEKWQTVANYKYFLFMLVILSWR